MTLTKKPVTDEIKENSDGSRTLTVSLTPDAAANFFAACNLVSAELGRPVSKAEAVLYMVEQALKEHESK